MYNEYINLERVKESGDKRDMKNLTSDTESKIPRL